MPDPRNYLAIDLGAESGRLMLGAVGAERLDLREIHRFSNTPVRRNESLFWNIPNLVLEIKQGLRKAAGLNLEFESVSVDSWGVDYIFFDEAGEILPPVYHYRDPRTRMGVAKALERVPREEIFEHTGIQFMPINTLFQLSAEDPNRLNSAGFLLGIADAVNFFLSGERKAEVSLASTFQLYNPRTKDWAWPLIDTLGFKPSLFPQIIPSGARIGSLRDELAAELALPRLPVVATCSHDTGAAVAGVPACDPGRWAYLSSGTWSLMGVELDSPVINQQSRELNFTNEIGYGGTVRLLKNISGLWLVQECKRAWEREGRNFSYADLTRLAGEATPFRSLINPAGGEFLAPDSMPQQIADYCRRTNQPIPETPGQFIRCALESLALLYRRTLNQLAILTGQTFERLHVVGGGVNNELLNQFTANATRLQVVAGPAEATAAGNVIIQALASGQLKSLDEGRRLIRNSSVLQTYLPRDPELWSAAAGRFQNLPAVV